MIAWLSGFKGWLYVIVAVLMVCTGLWVYWHGRSVGDERGAARVQRLWDRNLAEIAALAERQRQDNAATLKAAQDRNKGIIDDYEKRIADSDNHRIRLERLLYNARLAADRSRAEKDSDQPGAAEARAQAILERVDQLLGSALADAKLNADQLDALIAEIEPQL